MSAQLRPRTLWRHNSHWRMSMDVTSRLRVLPNTYGKKIMSFLPTYEAPGVDLDARVIREAAEGLMRNEVARMMLITVHEGMHTHLATMPVKSALGDLHYWQILVKQAHGQAHFTIPLWHLNDHLADLGHHLAGWRDEAFVREFSRAAKIVCQVFEVMGLKMVITLPSKMSGEAYEYFNVTTFGFLLNPKSDIPTGLLSLTVLFQDYLAAGPEAAFKEPTGQAFDQERVNQAMTAYQGYRPFVVNSTLGRAARATMCYVTGDEHTLKYFMSANRAYSRQGTDGLVTLRLQSDPAAVMRTQARKPISTTTGFQHVVTCIPPNDWCDSSLVQETLRVQGELKSVEVVKPKLGHPVKVDLLREMGFGQREEVDIGYVEFLLATVLSYQVCADVHYALGPVWRSVLPDIIQPIRNCGNCMANASGTAAHEFKILVKNFILFDCEFCPEDSRKDHGILMFRRLQEANDGKYLDYLYELIVEREGASTKFSLRSNKTAFVDWYALQKDMGFNVCYSYHLDYLGPVLTNPLYAHYTVSDAHAPGTTIWSRLEPFFNSNNTSYAGELINLVTPSYYYDVCTDGRPCALHILDHDHYLLQEAALDTLNLRKAFQTITTEDWTDPFCRDVRVTLITPRYLRMNCPSATLKYMEDSVQEFERWHADVEWPAEFQSIADVLAGRSVKRLKIDSTPEPLMVPPLYISAANTFSPATTKLVESTDFVYKKRDKPFSRTQKRHAVWDNGYKKPEY